MTDQLKETADIKMIPYNVSEKKLALPEYGRNVQRMVDHCLTIEDRDERTRCAKEIADVMATLFPSIIGENGDRRKIWDHIYIMSDFKLDIDFPCEVISPEEMKRTVEKIPYTSQFNRFRHYGKNIQTMIKNVAEMENCVEKDQLIFLLANQMKKLLVVGNPENASDTRVFGDIAELSEGKIVIDPSTYRLNDYIDTTPATGKGKKKKK